MIQCTCIVQQDQAADRNRHTMHNALQQFVNDAFKSRAQITWIPVTAGDGFTAAKPSTASIVSMTAPTPLSPSRRKSLLRRLAALWRTSSGCGINEIVAVITDPT